MVKVSVIIPSFNRYNTLTKAVASALEQTHPDMEIIVVNDGSTQKEYETPIDNVIWIDLKPNTKQKFGFPCPGHARNQGLQRASGEWIAFLDDDDYWYPHKIETQLQLMEKHQVLMACADADTHRGKYNGKVAANYIQRATRRPTIPPLFDLPYIKMNNTIIFSSLMVHHTVIHKVGSFMEVDICGGKDKIYEDYEFNKSCLQHTNCVYSEQPLLYYNLRA